MRAFRPLTVSRPWTARMAIISEIAVVAGRDWQISEIAVVAAGTVAHALGPNGAVVWIRPTRGGT